MKIKSRKLVAGGFTLAEILVSLVILGLLMTAVAVAFQAHAVNFRANRDMCKALNQSRQVLHRITTELRTAVAVKHDDPSNECTMVTSDGRDITYRYDADVQKLYLETNGDTSDPDYLLCEDVSDISFTRSMDPVNPTTVRNVQISMTVTVNGVSQKVVTAAVVRRNI